MSSNRVVITGMGPITSIGIGSQDLWNSILSEKSNVKKESFIIDNKEIDSFQCHKVDNFDIYNFGIDNSALIDIRSWKGGEDDIDLNYLIGSIKLALDDSELEYSSDNDISLIVGHGNPGLEEFWDKLFNKTYDILKKTKMDKAKYFDILFDEVVKTSYDLQTYMYLFHLSKLFNLHGSHLFLNNACSSGLYALEVASNLIKMNKCKVAVVACSGLSRIYKYLWFRQYGYPYAEDGLIKPFDKNANGIVVGDGSIALIVEDLNYAKKRNAKVYGEYLGGGFNSESWKVTLPAVGTDYYKNTMIDALKNCNLKSEEIDLINPHGTGLSVIDKYEVKALTNVFNNPCLTAFKPYFGHCIGASALLEAGILLMALKEDVIPGTLNTTSINPKFKISLVKKNTKCALNLVMKTCCAIAGFNASVIFKKIEV